MDINNISEQYGIRISDGREDSWTFYSTEVEARNEFNRLKIFGYDIHLYQLNEELGYEVIDSFSVEEI